MCYRNPARAQQVNVAGAVLLTDLCAASAARLLFVSTDLVFDGNQGNYSETAAPRPLSVYGHSKRAGEQVVLSVASTWSCA